REDGRLARRGLADEDTGRAGHERDVARTAVAGDRHLVDQGHAARSTREGCSSKRTAGSRAARRDGASGTGTTRGRTGLRPAPCNRGGRGPAADAAGPRTRSGNTN